MPSRVPPGPKETADGEFFVCALSKPGLHRKVPGLFVCPAGGIGIRACLRNMKFRVRSPGGVPDFFAEANELLHWSGNVTGTSGSFFYNLGCGKYRADIAQREERDVADVEA